MFSRIMMVRMLRLLVATGGDYASGRSPISFTVPAVSNAVRMGVAPMR